MNRQMRRASEVNGRHLSKLPFNKFEECTIEARKKHELLSPGSDFRPDIVYKNNRYIVQCFTNRTILGMHATKLMIRKSNSEKVVEWHDLQRIKSELFGDTATAIQVFPPENELIDDFNIYWLWVLEC